MLLLSFPNFYEDNFNNVHEGSYERLVSLYYKIFNASIMEVPVISQKMGDVIPYILIYY